MIQSRIRDTLLLNEPCDGSSFPIKAYFVNGGDDLSGSSVITELAEIDALPGSHIQSPVGDWDRKAHSEKRTLGVCRHVIRALQSMFIVRFPFLHHMIQDGFHVRTHIRVIVLIDRKRA